MKGPSAPSAEERKMQQDQENLLKEQQVEEDQRKSQVAAREIDLIHREQGSGQNSEAGNGFGGAGAAPPTQASLSTSTPAIIQPVNPDGKSFQQPLDTTIGGG